MGGDCDGEWLSFVGRRLPGAFAARSVTIAVGGERAYEQAGWADALVVVEEGEIELECLGGARARFAAGAVLVFDSLPLQTLRNTRREPALLIGVSRRARSNGLVPGSQPPSSLAPHDAASPWPSPVCRTDELTPCPASYE